MKNEEKVKMIEQYISSYNSMNVQGMLELLHEEVVFRNYSTGEVNVETQGIMEFGALAERSTKMFKQRKQVIRDIIYDEERIIVEIDYHGILDVDLPNGLKAGQEIELSGKSIFEFINSQISLIEDHS